MIIFGNALLARRVRVGLGTLIVLVLVGVVSGLVVGESLAAVIQALLGQIGDEPPPTR
ncbi:hypothetical protein [Nocardioides pacificus]